MKLALRSWLLGTRTPQPEQAPGRGPAPRRLVGIGHSHLQALQDACSMREQADPWHAPARFVQMLAPAFNPTVQADGSLNPALLAAIQAELHGEGPPPMLFDCVSGNEYHFIGLVKHPRPYDFVLPSRPDLPLQPHVEIIPAPLMRRALEAQMGHAIAVLKALRAAFSESIWHVQSPPPLPSDQYIRENPTYFADQVAQRGVAPAAFRMKLWLLQSDLYRAHCEALGIGFLGVPAAACDAEGFLREPGWLPDPAHANSWYGGLVLQQLDALPATPTHGATPGDLAS